MQMTDDEIRSSMRKAKNPAEQVKVLAELNACGEAEVRAQLEQLGIAIPAKKPKAWKFDTARAAQLLAEGKTDLEAAEMLGITKQTFSSWRRAMKLPVNSEPHRPVRRKKAAPAPGPAVPVSGEPGTMTAARMAEIFTALAQWHPDAAVSFGEQDIRRVELVSTYEGAGEPVLRVRIE